MIKNQQVMPDQPIYKKIQNYIFKFSDLLGQGNFSKVYKAHHELTNDIVAIKIVELESLKSKKLEQLLFSQIDVLKKLNHPNILKCYEVFTSNRNCYIITELCNQGDLQSKLRKQRYFNQYKAEPIIKDIFEGLCYLAQKNVIHRDVKVANIFVNNNKVKIADFGFAKFTKDTFKDINIGSPIYMSPEGFIDNVYGPKTDVWAFGILMYQLLHGQTPYSSCRTQNQLKQALLIPLTKNKLKSQLSNEIKQAIIRCLQIDHNKRISIHQLSNLPYFRRIMNKDQNLMNLPVNPFNHGNYGSALQLRLRSPSYNGDKMMRSQQQQLKRKISVQKPVSQFNPSGIIKTTQPYQNNNHNYVGIAQTSKNFLQMPSQQVSKKDRRAISTQRQIFMMNSNKQSTKPQFSTELIMKNNQNLISNNKFYILSGILSFKECVNILHYGRLIFKFLLTLKISQYSNDNELFKLSKWLMQLLTEMHEKIQKKQIIYEGDNALMRQQKLKEVRNEYQKKYRTQLSNYITNQNFIQQFYNLDYMKTYCYNLFQKYDSMINKQNNKSLIMLGHCIVMMCDTTKLLKRCFEDQNYNIFLNYKDIQSFLNMAKDTIDINSYYNYKKKMNLYN